MSPRHAVRARPRAPRHSRRVRRHAVVRGVALALTAVLAFGVSGATTGYVRLQNNIETRDVTDLLGDDRPPVHVEPVDPQDPEAGRPLNVLLMGSDVRDGENAEIGGEVEGMRSDTTIVMHVSADRDRLDFVSIPRDSHVDIPRCERSDGSATRAQTGRFNAAFALGGDSGEVADAAACTIRTVEALTDVRIDGWMVVDFAGFVTMVDALDGIPMCIPHEMRSEDAGLHVEPGYQVLDGRTALAFARARTGTGLGNGSDIGRLGRQQELLAATANEVLSKNLLTDSTALYRFLTAATRSVTADPELGSIANLAGLAFSLRDIPSGNITFMTIPIESYAPDPNQVVWTDEAADVWANMAADVPLVAAPEPGPEPTAPAGEESAAPVEPSPTEVPQPGVDPFTPDDVTTVCG